MLYLTSSMISGVDLAHYEVSRPEDWGSVDCGTSTECLKLKKSERQEYRFTLFKERVCFQRELILSSPSKFLLLTIPRYTH